LGCAFIQIGYWGFVFSKLIFYQEKAPATKPLPVSVLVCSHNHGKSLVLLINELLLQTHPDFEIVIVDDRSSDGTSG
jgi:hypothetical protein